MSYNPGVPSTVTNLAPGLYIVDSFTEAAGAYAVNLKQGTCDCPHYTRRLAGTGQDCKHLKAARAERWNEVAAKAASLDTAHLEELLPTYEEKADWTVATAIRGELFDRQQAAGSWA